MKHRAIALVALCALLLPRVAGADTVDLSATSADLHVLGPDANTYMGFSVATGDVNGDGLDDLIMGAPYASPGGRSSAGKVFVTFGAAGMAAVPDTVDLSATADVVIEGALASGLLGYRVAAGDLDGDGDDELLLGAPFAWSQAGAVYVIDGDPALGGTIDLSATSATITFVGVAGSRAGTGLAAGDVDGDRVDDLLIGAMFANASSRTRAGRVDLFYGANLTGATIYLSHNVADLVVLGVSADDNLGNDVAVADIDGDGLGEVIMAAYHADVGTLLSAGEVYILAGSSTYSGTHDLASSPTMARIRAAAEGDQAGQAIALADMNYDGVADLAVGANAADPAGRTSAGTVYVVDGQNLSGTVDLAVSDNALLTVYGAAANNGLGFDLTMLNANGDGMADLLIGEPFAATYGAQTGEVHLITGDTQLPSIIDLSVTPADRRIIGGAGGANHGRAVAAGDLDGDGLDEMVIGAAGATGVAGGAGQTVAMLGLEPNVDVSTPDTTAPYASSVQIPIRVDATTGLKMVEFDLDLLYDGSVLAFDTLDAAGSLIDGWDTLSVAVIAGGGDLDTLRLSGRTTGAPSTTTGDFAVLTFDVADWRVPTSSPVSVDSLLFNGGRPEWNDLTAGSLTVTGTDAVLTASILSSPGDTVRVRVIDPDFNRVAGSAQALTAVVTHPSTGEVETLSLTEWSADDSVFFGVMPTVAGVGAGTDDDGIMQVADGDSLRVSVTDTLDAVGSQSDRTADHLVLDPLGDADDNGSLQAFDASRILFHAAGFSTLSGRDSLAANVDSLAPAGPINSFDAVLVIQRALGLIPRFPVQASSALNHPQPETVTASPKRLPDPVALRWTADGADLVLWADRRERILAADLTVAGLDPDAARVLAGDDLPEARLAHHGTTSGLRVALAVPVPVEGPGTLLRLQAVDGTPLPPPDQLHLTGSLNGGQLPLQTLVAGGTASPTLPRALRLIGNHPNPFNAETTIRFDLPADGPVQLAIYNTVGQQIRRLADGALTAGSHQVVWDGRNEAGDVVASGLYVYVLTAEGQRLTRPLMLLK